MLIFMLSLVFITLAFIGGMAGAALVMWYWPETKSQGKNPFRTADWEPMFPYEDDSLGWNVCDHCGCTIYEFRDLCLSCRMADDEQQLMDRDKGDS